VSLLGVATLLPIAQYEAIQNQEHSLVTNLWARIWHPTAQELACGTRLVLSNFKSRNNRKEYLSLIVR
jgi:hypothetical protein